MAVIWGLYFHVIKGCSGLTLKGSPLSQILADRFMCNYDSMTKKELVFYGNTGWLMYTLDYGGKWSLNGS